MAKNFPLGLGGLILLATSILFLFFIILSAVSSATPLDKTYFLRANTAGITGARDWSHWTYFYVCGDGNTDCTPAKAGMPIGRAWDAGAQNVPDGLGGSYGGGTTSHKFFYMWRFGWVFILMTLFFEIWAFLSGFLACCGRLGAAISFLVAGVALVCHTVASSLFTATFVMARNRFRGAGRDASLGRWGFGWIWGSYAALLVATLLFALGMRRDKTGAGAGVGTGTGSGAVIGGRRGHGVFGRRRSARSLETHRVKDDYS